MDKRKKMIIGVSATIIIGIIIIIILIIINNNKDNSKFEIEGIHLPENKEVLKDTTMNNLKISKVSILTRKKMSTFQAKLSNVTDNDIYIKSFSIVFYKNNKETKIEVFRNITINAKEEEKINLVSELDLTDITKIEYIAEL